MMDMAEQLVLMTPCCYQLLTPLPKRVRALQVQPDTQAAAPATNHSLLRIASGPAASYNPPAFPLHLPCVCLLLATQLFSGLALSLWLTSPWFHRRRFSYRRPSAVAVVNCPSVTAVACCTFACLSWQLGGWGIFICACCLRF